MSLLKPLVLYSHPSGPNPWKTIIIMEELNLPYEIKNVDFEGIKKAPYTDLNPNGRIPTIVDPNTNLTLWESCAINQYLIETYDKSHALSYTTFPETHLCNQWMFFQASGQGPYYGQAIWFLLYHSEKIPSAMKRYANETERVISVLDAHLQRQGGDAPYLVGDKCTYADLSFVTWNEFVPFILKGNDMDVEGKYPQYEGWMKRLLERPAVKKAMADKAKAKESAQS